MRGEDLVKQISLLALRAESLLKKIWLVHSSTRYDMHYPWTQSLLEGLVLIACAYAPSNQLLILANTIDILSVYL